MNSESPTFLILADESAAWRIAGLTQLDRLVLAINELAEANGTNTIVNAVIFWRSDIPSHARWLPRHPKINRVHLTESVKSIQGMVQVLDTHVFAFRRGLSQLLQEVSVPEIEGPLSDSSDSWAKLRQDFQAALQTRSRRDRETSWRYVEGPDDIRACETEFLRGAGKSQDGFISRLVNRPISRAVSQKLLKYDIDPNTWTFAILIVPAIAFFVMLRGDYFGFVAGLTLFQLYSILDGCDGEIARAKYLESERGGKIDTWTDIFGGFVFILGLGCGLFNKHLGENASPYLLQAIACVAFIAINEYRLRGGKAEAAAPANGLLTTLYPRHQTLVHHSGILVMGEKLVWWLVQFTKRDVSIFVFFLLAVGGRPEWILPLWMAVTIVVLVLGEIARWKRRLPAVEGHS